MTAVTTVIGNLTSDPELRYSQNGIAIASFTVASTDKIFGRAKNEWVDGKKLLMRCTAWSELAEHAAGSLAKGARVITVGKIATDEYEDKEGSKRLSINMTVDEIGPLLRYATASVTRAQHPWRFSRRNRGTVGAVRRGFRGRRRRLEHAH